MRAADDVALAVAAGADAIGTILVPRSKRFVEAEALRAIAVAVPPLVAKIAVIGDGTPDEAIALAAELGFAFQFADANDDVTVARIAAGRPYLRVVHVPREGAVDAELVDRYAHDPLAMLMFDTASGGARGGTGVSFAWDAVVPIARARPVVVAGGLHAGNVAACVREVRPFAVDVASGIESDGRKDGSKMRAFVEAVREADRLIDARP